MVLWEASSGTIAENGKPSHAGVVTYDDRFAYSHHATDPASGRLLNAFDLVRIHLFGSLDDAEDTTSNHQPSFAEMTRLALSDEAVKAILSQERMEKAGKDFTEKENWQTALELDKKGTVKDTLDNLVLIMRHDEALVGITFNSHRDGIDSRGELPWEQIKAGHMDLSDNAREALDG